MITKSNRVIIVVCQKRENKPGPGLFSSNFSVIEIPACSMLLKWHVFNSHAVVHPIMWHCQNIENVLIVEGTCVVLPKLQL